MCSSQTEMEQPHTINYSEHCVDPHKTLSSLVILPQGKLLHFILKNKLIGIRSWREHLAWGFVVDDIALYGIVGGCYLELLRQNAREENEINYRFFFWRSALVAWRHTVYAIFIYIGQFNMLHNVHLRPSLVRVHGTRLINKNLSGDCEQVWFNF